MKQTASATIGKLFMACGVCVALAATGHAQVQTQTSTTSGASSHHTSVEQGTVVSVNGNNLFVKMQDGTVRDFPNVSESARVTVDGKQLGIHDLKPGMTLQKTITTTTTPQTVTTVQTVTGKVWYVTPPLYVILTLEDGTNQKFKIPKDQKFNIDGQMVDAWGLKKGMKVTATKIVETPVTSVHTASNVTGEMPPIPPDQPVLVAAAEPQQAAPAAAPATEAAPQQLPKTGSELPLIGFLGILLIGFSLGIRRLSRR
jgi:LPXTG-motif cell wall-anchored protein